MYCCCLWLGMKSVTLSGSSKAPRQSPTSACGGGRCGDTANLGAFKSAFHREITANDVEQDLFVVETWSASVDWALSQAEESFCDFVGLRVFGALISASIWILAVPEFQGNPVRPLSKHATPYREHDKGCYSVRGPHAQGLSCAV